MSFIKTLFKKELNDILLEDLQEFFRADQEESSILEFKSGEVSIEDIYKEICAFLNTEGGVLIIGTPREQKVKVSNKSSQLICKGDLMPFNIRGKDWLIQKIASNIVPSPTGINAKEILTPEGNYFIIQIPQSLNPPHQSSDDGRYYIRLEREAKPAPHGLVQALFYKRQKPKFEIEPSFGSDDLNPKINEVQIAISNLAEYPADRVYYIIELFNVKEANLFLVNKRKQFNTFNGRMLIHGQNKNPLIKGLRHLITVRLLHLNKVYIIKAAIWNKDTDLLHGIYVYDPFENRIIKSSDNINELPKFIKYADQINKHR